ncbi:hypothetical protein DP761_24450, partial [Salmonella enterica subsp. enterica]|nr:hypothetical protein [Salmonella enterica subsp. enterica serovar Reading]MLO26082.1 hypothetical protein [Salmonella enterica subsp. enterica serovar Reading]
PDSFPVITSKILRNNATANGKATDEVEVKVADKYGNVFVDQPVNFTATSGIVSPSVAYTNDKGIVRASISSFQAGSLDLTIQVGFLAPTVQIVFINRVEASTVHTSIRKLADGNFEVAVSGLKAQNGVQPTNSVILTSNLGRWSQEHTLKKTGDGTYIGIFPIDVAPVQNVYNLKIKWNMDNSNGGGELYWSWVSINTTNLSGLTAERDPKLSYGVDW